MRRSTQDSLLSVVTLVVLGVGLQAYNCVFAQIGKVNEIKVKGRVEPKVERAEVTKEWLQKLKYAGVSREHVDKLRNLHGLDATDFIETGRQIILSESTNGKLTPTKVNSLLNLVKTKQYIYFGREKPNNHGLEGIWKGDELERNDELTTRDEVEAHFEIFKPNQLGQFLCTQYPNTIVRLVSQRRQELIDGNENVFVNEKFIISKNPKVKSPSKSTFYMNASSRGLGVLVLDGFVLMSKGGGVKIVRAGEYGVFHPNGSYLSGSASEINELERKLRQLRSWRTSLTQKIARKNRLKRLMRTSGFATVNTGSGLEDIRKPATQLGANAFGMGQIRIMVRPPN